MNKNRFFERNITLNYIIGALMWGRFFIPVLALFYIASQVTLAQFTIIMAVFSLSTLLLEIPTGVIADLLGKKKTLLLSRAMYVIEIIMLAFFNGFWIFLIAKIISGIGVSLSSGTNQALLYDSLKRLKRQEEHKKISGLASTISKISMALVFIMGGYLFSINPKLPAILSLIPITLGFILTFLIKEPYPPKKAFNWENSIAHLKEGLGYFKKNSYLIYLALLTLLIGSTIIMMQNLSSSYFEIILIPVAFMGLVNFVLSLIAAYSSKKAHSFEQRLGEKKSLLFISLTTAISILLMAITTPYLGLVFFALLFFTQGFYEVIIGDYVNRHVKTSHRATMLSINNMFDNIGVFIAFPILGYSIGKIGMSQSILYFGIILGILLLVISIFYLIIKKK